MVLEYLHRSKMLKLQFLNENTILSTITAFKQTLDFNLLQQTNRTNCNFSNFFEYRQLIFQSQIVASITIAVRNNTSSLNAFQPYRSDLGGDIGP